MNKRISVWVVETYFKDTDTPGQSAWSTKKLALEAAEFYLKSCSGVENNSTMPTSNPGGQIKDKFL